MHRKWTQPLSRLSGTRLLEFPHDGPRGSVGTRRERCARGLVTLVNSSAGPKLSGEVIHKAPLVRERSSPVLNEHWQPELLECLGLQPWVMCEKCHRVPFPAPHGACAADRHQQSWVPMENSFPACLLLHAPWKNPVGSSLLSQEDVGVPELQNELFSFKKHREI